MAKISCVNICWLHFNNRPAPLSRFRLLISKKQRIVTEKFLIIAHRQQKKSFKCWSKATKEGKHFHFPAFVCFCLDRKTSRLLAVVCFLPSSLCAHHNVWVLMSIWEKEEGEPRTKMHRVSLHKWLSGFCFTAGPERAIPEHDAEIEKTKEQIVNITPAECMQWCWCNDYRKGFN